MKLRLVAFVLGAFAFAVGCSTASATTFSRGFADDVWFDSPADGISSSSWIAKTESTGARFVQIEVDWAGVEPHAPTKRESLTNPAAPEFNFHSLDAKVQEFVKTSLEPVFLVTDAPRWAEAAGGTAAQYATGGYKPNTAAFGHLAAALAKRYSGHFPSPLNPRTTLPRVRYLQAWAEANTPNHLSPQWIKRAGRFVNIGPIIYRRLLNAFYAGVKSVDPSDVVLATGLEGYGDAPGQGLMRTHPVTFMENLLCLHSNLRPTACPDPAHFDVLASDPYDVDAPTVHAISPLDATAPDLGRLRRVVRAALAARTLFPIRPKALWVTEFGYDSDPPDPIPGTLSAATQARWLEESFYVFWREGVSTVIWYLVRDQTRPYDKNYFSGVYFRSGRPKPSYTAYRFPFIVMQRGGHAQIWGISPVSGTLHVQIRNGTSWRTVASIGTRSSRVFARLLSLASGRYRATVGDQTSLAWNYQPVEHRSGGQQPAIRL